MRKINISDVEKVLLRGYSASPLALLRYKSQAILMASKGMSSVDIGDVLGRKDWTVILWLRDWHNRHMASIFTGHQDNNNAGKLTPEQRAEVQQVLQSPPSDFDLPQTFWDVPQLKSYIAATFGVVYESDQAYHYLLKFGNLSFKYPDTFDRKRDETVIEQRMTAIKAELQPLFHNDRWEIFAVDEVRMDQEAITRRVWLAQGERTIVKVNRNKESQSYIGFLNQKSFVCEVFEMPWQNQQEVLKALEQFLEKHPDKLICLVWDNALFHKGKDIRAALAKGRLLERVHLVAMPPYAPDHNPIEHVWNTAKQSVANIQHETFSETKQAFSSFVSGQRFQYSF